MRSMTSQLAIAAVLASGMIGPALADVTVLVDVDKDKTIRVEESISKDVSITIEMLVDLDGLGAAEAQALANVENSGHDFSVFSPDTYVADLIASVIGNSGITQVNQAAGLVQNQGDLVAVALADSGDVFVDAQAEVEQINEGNILVASFTPFTATISGSISGTGVTQVNQDVGQANNQTNALAAAAGLGTLDEPEAMVALAEAALGQENSENFVIGALNTRTATTTGSVNGNIGITQVNQAASIFGNQANLAGVSAAVAF